MTDKPLVSVIIPTYNRDKCVVDCLESLLNQDYKPYEIIVIDQSATPQPAKDEYLRNHSEIKTVRFSPPNRCAAKSKGIQVSSGDIALICDDDIIAPANLISSHVKHYKNEKIGAVSTRVLETSQPETYTSSVLKFSFYGRLFNNSHSKWSGKVHFLNGGNMSFRRLLFNAIGYFDEEYIGTGMMEEPDISIRIRRLGYEIYFDGDCTVMHYPQYNGNSEIRNKQRIIWYKDFYYNFARYHLKFRIYWRYALSFIWMFLLLINQKIKYRIANKELIEIYLNLFKPFKND